MTKGNQCVAALLLWMPGSGPGMTKEGQCATHDKIESVRMKTSLTLRNSKDAAMVPMDG